METIKEIVAKLNDMLHKEEIELSQFSNFFLKLKDHLGVKLKLVDFEYFNEERLNNARKEKIIAVTNRDFELAASKRDIEKKCINYVDIKKEFDIEQSIFHYEKNYLLYFFLGTANNDKLVKELYKKFV